MGKHSAEVPELTHASTAAEMLADLPDDWFVLDQVHEVSPEVAAVDRVVVGPGGVFVIVSTDWRGPVSFQDGDVLDGASSRQAEVEVVLDTAVEVARLSGTYAEWIVPVLAVESDESFRGTVLEVQVVSTADLLVVLDEPGTVLPASHVKYAAELLRSAGRPEQEPEPVVEMPPRVEPDATAPMPVLTLVRDVPEVDETDEIDEVPAPVAVVAEPPPEPDPGPEASGPTGPDGQKLTGRAARVAAALETAAAQAALLAEHQNAGEDGKKKSKKPKDPKDPKDFEKHTRVTALVRLIVLVVLVGVGGLFGPRIVPAVEDAVGMLDGKPACVQPTTAGPVDAPVTVPTPTVGKNGQKLTKAQQARALKRAQARAAKLAAKPVKAQALAEATC